MRGDGGGHTDRDTAGTIDQKVREMAGQDRGLLQGTVEVRDEVDRVLVQVGEHLHGDLTQTCLGITHGRLLVTIDRTEVAVSIDQHVAHVEVLRQMDHGVVNGRVTMGMIFTHGIAHDTRRLTVRLVRAQVQLAHGVQDAALYRLETVTHIRQRTRRDDTHRVIDVVLAHGPFQIDRFDAVKLLVLVVFYIISHIVFFLYL